MSEVTKYPLHEAVIEGDLKTVVMLLNNGVAVDNRNPNQRTPLHEAARMGNVDMAKLLLDRGANPNALTSDGENPLHMAMSPAWAPVILNHNMVSLLLDSGCNIEQRDTAEGWTPLHTCVASARMASPERTAEAVAIAKVLISRGAKVDGVSTSGITPLHRAIKEATVELVRCLLEYGADPHLHSKTWGKNAIDIAEEQATAGWDDWGKPHIRDELLQLIRNSGKSAEQRVSKERIDQQTSKLDEDLLQAVEEGNTNTVEALLAQGADVNAAHKEEITVLMVAASHGYVSIVKVLLNYKADVNTVASNGFTALIYAATGGHVTIVEVLLQQGADVNAVSHQGSSALWAAVVEDHANVVNFLLKHGVEPM